MQNASAAASAGLDNADMLDENGIAGVMSEGGNMISD